MKGVSLIHAGEYKPNNFTPVVGAMELADYVITITDNVNKFPDYTMKKRSNDDGAEIVIVQRQDSLVNWVREQVRNIFILTYTANEITVNKQPWRKNERLEKQAHAIELCGEHLAAIQLCRKHYHLSNKKVKYWGGKVRDLRSSIEAWHESDKGRYKNI